MKTYVIYLNEWPYPHQGTMNSLSMFSLKHFISLIFNILMGMLFGVESFIGSVQSIGKWKVDKKRLLIVGLPLLLFSIEAIHFYFLENVFKVLGMSIFYLVAPAREPFFRFALGYVLLTSVYKDV